MFKMRTVFTEAMDGPIGRGVTSLSNMIIKHLCMFSILSKILSVQMIFEYGCN